MEFGNFIRERRLLVNLSLRKFCDLCNLDPSNWSKIERGRLPLKYDRQNLEKIASVLQIEPGSKDWLEFFDLATIASKVIPDYVYSDEELLKALPVFFRTASNNKPSDKELNEIIELIKKR